MEAKAEEEEGNGDNGGRSSSGLGGLFRKSKEHMEAYPYVWGSYALVYGGIGLWFTYRWRKLRQTEDRVRALQKQLRIKYEAEEQLPQSSSTTKLLKDQSPKNPSQ